MNYQFYITNNNLLFNKFKFRHSLKKKENEIHEAEKLMKQNTFDKEDLELKLIDSQQSLMKKKEEKDRLQAIESVQLQERENEKNRLKYNRYFLLISINIYLKILFSIGKGKKNIVKCITS